jgi:hypothetical protein
VIAPPIASVEGRSPARAEGHEDHQAERQQLDQEADGPRGAGIEAAQERRLERPPEVARERPAENYERDDTRDSHLQIESEELAAVAEGQVDR